MAQMRPMFSVLEAGYPRKLVKRAELYTQYGWASLANDPQYENTCAMRMSIALAKAGVVLTKGGLRIQAGSYKGKRAEPSMRKLASYLAEMWGAPEKYEGGEAARKGIGQRRGVVAFFFGSTLPLVGAQGHIDIVSSRPSGFIECAGACFFSPLNKVWFWPLQ